MDYDNPSDVQDRCNFSGSQNPPTIPSEQQSHFGTPHGCTQHPIPTSWLGIRWDSFSHLDASTGSTNTTTRSCHEP